MARPGSPRAGRVDGRVMVALLLVAAVLAFVVGACAEEPSAPTLPVTTLGAFNRFPQQVIVGPGGLLYIAERVPYTPPGPASRGVAVRDPRTGAEVRWIGLDGDPQALAISPDQSRLYVTDFGPVGSLDDRELGSRVWVVDVVTGRVRTTIPVGIGPSAVAVSPDGRRVYVTNQGIDSGRTVSVIDTSTDTIVATLEVGRRPDALAVSPDSRQVYVTYRNHFDVGELGVIDTTTGTVTTPVLTLGYEEGSYSLALSPDGRRLHIVGTRGTGLVLDTATGRTTPISSDVLSVPSAVALSPDGRRLVVLEAVEQPERADRVFGQLEVLDTVTGTTLATTSASSLGAVRLHGLALDPGGRHAYVTALLETYRIDLP